MKKLNKLIVSLALTVGFASSASAAIIIGCAQVPGGENCLICNDSKTSCRVVSFPK